MATEVSKSCGRKLNGKMSSQIFFLLSHSLTAIFVAREALRGKDSPKTNPYTWIHLNTNKGSHTKDTHAPTVAEETQVSPLTVWSCRAGVKERGHETSCSDSHIPSSE